MVAAVLSLKAIPWGHMKGLRMFRIKVRFLVIVMAVLLLSLGGCSNSTEPEVPSGGGGTNTVETPTFSLPAGPYEGAQTVALSTTTESASINYTTDGTTPSETTGTAYTAPLLLSETQTIKAIAFKTDMTNSAVASAAYNISGGTEMVAAPTFTPSAGIYEETQMVEIVTATEAATIHYTTDGSAPTESTGTPYTSAVIVSESQTLNAVAFKTDLITSGVVTADYTITGPPAPILYDWTVEINSGSYAGVYGAPNGNIYAVGNRFLSIDRGAGWDYESIEDFNFSSIHGTASDNIYGTGSSGQLASTVHKVMRYDGNAWSLAWTSGVYAVSAVYAVDDVVFVARTTGAARFDGTNWRIDTVGAQGEIMGDVFARSVDEAYLVGDHTSAYSWNGVVWSDMAFSSLYDLRAVHGAQGGTYTYFVGYNGIIFRWDGASWEEMTSNTTQDLVDVYAISDTDVYAVGRSGNIMHYDGSTWTDESEGLFKSLKSITRTDNRLLIVGHAGGVTEKIGGSWVHVGNPLPIVPNSFGGISDSDMWAVGSYGQLAHYNGSTWTHVESGAVNHIRGVMAFASDDVWMCGDQSSIWHWDGSSISFDQLNTDVYMRALWGVAPDDMWAGDFNHWDGTSWTRITPDEVYGDMTTIWGTASDNVYGVGVNVNNNFASTIYHWDGTSWTLTNLGKRANMAGIWGTGPNDIFTATQANGDVFHFDGTSWTEMSTPSTPLMLNLSGSASNNIFMSGQDGVMLHYDGMSWDYYDSGVTLNINQLIMFSESSGVAMTSQNGMVLRYGF